MSADVVTLVIPARTEYLVLARLALAGIARGVTIDESTLADLKLAVTEACGNAVRHAQRSDHQGVVRVRYAIGDGAIEIRVEDDGPGFGTRTRSDVPDDELSESGMGLAIIRALVDELEIGERGTGAGTAVRMRKLLATG